MKKELMIGVLALVILGIFLISGCIKKDDIEQIPESELREICEKESWPPGGCSVIADPQGRRLCEKCKELLGYVKGEDIEQIPESELQGLCEKESWSPDCSMIPDLKGKEMCEKCKELGIGGKTVDKGMPESELERICAETTWPSDCSMVPDPTGKEFCEKCKKLAGIETVEGIIKEEDTTQVTSFKGRGFGTYDSDWSPDGTQIVFVRGGRDIGDEQGLYVINSDGTGLTKIGPSSSSYTIYDPAWSPVDNRILGTGWEDQKIKSGLFIIDLDKDKTKKIFLGVEYAMFPAWSPDGKKIVYMAYDDSNSPLPFYDPLCDGTGVLASIWVMNSDGTGKKQLTTEEDGYCSDPSFSPDGSKIVYNKGFVHIATPFLAEASPNEIWVMNSDGSNKHMIHTTGDSRYFLHQRAWSKNNEIIFEKQQVQETPEVWIMNPDGTNPRCLIKPVWDPDGKLLVYHDIAWDNTGTKITTSRHEVYEGKMPDVSHDIDSTSSHFKDSNLVTFPWKE